MNKIVVGVLGLIATGHYVASPYFRGDGDAPDAPPMASVTSIAPSMGTGTFNYLPVTVDTITDAEYAAPPSLPVTADGPRASWGSSGPARSSDGTFPKT